MLPLICISNRIAILQKRAVRCIHLLNYNDHTVTYFKNMKLLPVSKLFIYNIAIYMFKTLNIDNFDTCLLSSLFTFEDLHVYPTRNRLNYVLPRTKRVRTESSIKVAGVKIWNDVPAVIRSASSFFFSNLNLGLLLSVQCRFRSRVHNSYQFLLCSPSHCLFTV